MQAPYVFVSYSHDSESHRSRVLSFCARLREDGINVISDHRVASPPEGWPRWMQGQIASSNFVLLVMTETYRRRFEGRELQNGKGATFEGFLVTQAVYDSNCQNRRFIPVVFSTDDRVHIPAILQAATSYNVKLRSEYNRLYAALTSQPVISLPDLGDLRRVPSKAIVPHEFDDEDSSEPDLFEQPTWVDDSDVVATQVDSCVIELRIRRDFNTFSSDDQRRLLDTIGNLLNISGEIKVVSKLPGSVLLSLEMRPDQAESLYWLVHQGSLRGFDLSEARLLSESEAESTKLATPADKTLRVKSVLEKAEKLYAKTNDWVVFFREILGVNGLVRRLYPTPEELAAFEGTSEYADIQKMVRRLRDKPTALTDGQEVTRVITVRLPASVHEFLKAEAHDRKTSVNQLCITKLLQVMDDDSRRDMKSA